MGAGVSGADVTMADHWRELVTTAMLGTDRRDPPTPIGPLADVVADALRSAPSERMLDQVAACTAIRRAGVLPGPPIARLQGPDVDDRPICVPAAVDRWHHITVSWPVLEDEWMLDADRQRLARRSRARSGDAAAPSGRPRPSSPRRGCVWTARASWLVGHVPELEAMIDPHLDRAGIARRTPRPSDRAGSGSVARCARIRNRAPRSPT